MKTDYIFGIIIGFVFTVIIFYSVRKGKRIQYDERQNEIRGKAYQYACVTGSLTAIFGAILMDLLPMDGAFFGMLIGGIMITVFASYMCIKDVYFGLYVKWKPYTMLTAVLGVTNSIVGFGALITNGLPSGKLSLENTNVILGVGFLIITLSILLGKAKEKRDEAA